MSVPPPKTKLEAWRRWAAGVERCRVCWTQQELTQQRLIDLPIYTDEPRAVLVGEAPSLYRTEPGITFGGRSKEVYEAFLDAANLDRSEVYGTNVVKCALTRKRVGVHKNCVRWLFRELEILKVHSVIVFGRSAIEAVGGPSSIKMTTGEFYSHDIRFLTYPHPMLAIYHPEARESYIAGASSLFKRLQVKPKSLKDFI